MGLMAWTFDCKYCDYYIEGEDLEELKRTALAHMGSARVSLQEFFNAWRIYRA
jgi:hypothetical protein